MTKRFEIGILLVLLVFLLVMSFGFDFNGLYGQDPYEYRFFSEMLRSSWSGEVNDLPHFYFPFLYPAAGALLGFTGLPIPFALQLVSTLSLWLIFIITQRILTRFFNAEYFPAFVFLALFLLLCPYFVRFSVIVMSDLFAVALFLAAFYFFLALREKPGIWNAIGFSVLCALIVQLRYAFFPLVFIFGSWAFILLIRNKSWVPVFLMASSFIVASLPELLLRGRFLIYDMTDYSPAYDLQTGFWSFKNLFLSEFNNSDGLKTYDLPNIVQNLLWLFHPAFFSFAVPLLFFFRREYLSKSWYLVLYVLILYFIFVSGLTYQNKRYLLILVPFMILLIYPAWLNFWNRIANFRKFVLIIIPIQLVFIYFAMQPVIKMNREDRPMIRNEK